MFHVTISKAAFEHFLLMAKVNLNIQSQKHYGWKTSSTRNKHTVFLQNRTRCFYYQTMKNDGARLKIYKVDLILDKLCFFSTKIGIMTFFSRSHSTETFLSTIYTTGELLQLFRYKHCRFGIWKGGMAQIFQKKRRVGGFLAQVRVFGAKKLMTIKI